MAFQLVNELESSFIIVFLSRPWIPVEHGLWVPQRYERKTFFTRLIGLFELALNEFLFGESASDHDYIVRVSRTSR